MKWKCYLNNIPFVIIRAISDNPNETVLIDYVEFEKMAAIRCANITMCMIKLL